MSDEIKSMTKRNETFLHNIRMLRFFDKGRPEGKWSYFQTEENWQDRLLIFQGLFNNLNIDNQDYMLKIMSAAFIAQVMQNMEQFSDSLN